MGEFTARIRIAPPVSQFLKTHAGDPQLLQPLLESFWKPKGVSLRDFPPGKKAVRIRIFQDLSGPAATEELSFIASGGSYTDSRVKLFEGTLPDAEAFLEGKGYEKWTENRLRSFEYQIRLAGGATIKALEEEIDGQKTFVKFEAENEQNIEEVVKAMGLL